MSGYLFVPSVFGLLFTDQRVGGSDIRKVPFYLDG